MSYQLKRINPFWLTHPMIPTAVAIGGLCGLIGFARDSKFLILGGGIVAGLAIIMAARPIVSAVLATLGLLGGSVQFLLTPNPSAADLELPMRLVSVFLFGIFYTVLMDALVLVIAVLYNAFAGVVGLGGLTLELESAEEESAA